MAGILFNVAPYELDQRERARIAAISPHLLMQTANDGALASIDPSDVEILVTEEVPRDLSRWTSLRWVQLISAGTNQLDGHPVWEKPITVTTASGIMHVPMAQYLIGALRMFAHHLEMAAALRLHRTWPDREALAGAALRGPTIGIFGYGSIGRECARLAQALGMNVVAINRSGQRTRDEHFNAWPGTGDPDGSIPREWFSADQLEQALPRCDVLAICTPRTPQTAGRIGREQLDRLPRGAWVVVLSRGGIVDEAALCAALATGQVGAAAVDAYLKEPVDRDHCLFDAPNAIMTPHISGVFNGYWPKFCDLFRHNLSCWSRGRTLCNVARGERSI